MWLKLSFDESFAKATGITTDGYQVLLAILTAVTIVLGMRLMGALLISSLIIFPALTSMQIFKKFSSVVISSGVISVVCLLIGLLVATRIGSVDGNMGNAYEMDAIAACFIGGASAYGGSGTIQGVVVGALFLGVINMAMSILGLPDQWQYVVKGAVLLAAVIFDVVSSKKAAKA